MPLPFTAGEVNTLTLTVRERKHIGWTWLWCSLWELININVALLYDLHSLELKVLQLIQPDRNYLLVYYLKSGPPKGRRWPAINFNFTRWFPSFFSMLCNLKVVGRVHMKSSWKYNTIQKVEMSYIDCLNKLITSRILGHLYFQILYQWNYSICMSTINHPYLRMSLLYWSEAYSVGRILNPKLDAIKFYTLEL